MIVTHGGGQAEVGGELAGLGVEAKADAGADLDLTALDEVEEGAEAADAEADAAHSVAEVVLGMGQPVSGHLAASDGGGSAEQAGVLVALVVVELVVLVVVELIVLAAAEKAAEEASLDLCNKAQHLF